MKAKFLNFIFIVSLLSSCTFYTLVDGSSKYVEVTAIKIPQFRNDAGNGPPDIIAVFTEKTKDYFLQNGKFNIVGLNEDVSLECIITKYQSGITGATAQQTSAQNKLTISVSVDFIDFNNPDNNIKKTFEGREFYENNIDLSTVETELVETISDQIVTDIFNGTTMKTEW